jgi:hypothetical protein
MHSKTTRQMTTVRTMVAKMLRIEGRTLTGTWPLRMGLCVRTGLGDLGAGL